MLGLLRKDPALFDSENWFVVDEKSSKSPDVWKP